LDGEDERHVRVLAQSEAALPAILVHRDTMRIIDGVHRWRAAVVRGQETIEVEFFDGDEGDGFIAAVRVNVGHGLPLTLADREAAAARILRLRPHGSDRWIAEVAGLAAGTVRAIRRRLDGGESPVSARVGRDGRVRPIDPARGRLIASDAIRQHPSAPLREIARMAGVSPSTVQDVRERMSRGDDPVQLRQRTPQRASVSQRTDTAARPGATERHRSRAQGMKRDPMSLLHGLSRDPSLRFTESGRSLLRFLFVRAIGPRGGEELVEGVPAHCVSLLAEVAQSCAREWQEFADVLAQRARTSA
jgi:ParB-like chromosome segregation protein Spo0J